MERYMYAIHKNDICINRNELAARLGTPRGYTDSTVERCIAQVMDSCAPGCCYARVPVCLANADVAEFEFASFPSRDLYKNLEGCQEAYIIAITLGAATDRLVHRLSLTSGAESFVADAVASAVAEAVMDNVVGYLKESQSLCPQFSPGYGDFSVSHQGEILDFLCADKLLGIKLSESFLMIPKKSITAICGIKE